MLEEEERLKEELGERNFIKAMKDKEKFKEIDWEKQDRAHVDIPFILPVVNKMESAYIEELP